MAYLDPLLAGLKRILLNGVATVPVRPNINLVGSNWTVQDNPSLSATNILQSGSGGSSTYQTVEYDGLPLPQQPALNFIGGGWTVANNPSNGSTDVSYSGESVPDTRVALNHANGPIGTPYPLVVYDYYVIDPTSGTAGQLPTGAAAGSFVVLKMQVGKACSSANQFVCLAPAGGTVELPLGSYNGSSYVPTPGTSGASFAFNVSTFQGAGLTLSCDGANNWEISAR